MNRSAIQNIKEDLHSALTHIGNLEQCALLNYPNHLNIGDHLIWLGSILYLIDVLKTQINYVASPNNFSAEVMEKQVGKAPILIQGGGSLGDMWSDRQKFHEHIVSKYQDRKIIFLPQTIYFKSEDRLKQTKELLNSHGNLILFVRDNYSHELALKNFSKCQIIKAPDMAFQMVDMPELIYQNSPGDKILFLNREDKELNRQFTSDSIDIPNLVIDDWVSFHKKWKLGKPDSPRIQYAAKLYRGIWQRGLLTPGEWIHRQKWLSHQYKIHNLDKLHNPSMHRLSFSLMHSGIYQFTKYRFIVTNRLHGHILCLLLGIPHIFLPNSYYKNQAFYETWTHQVPFCRFVKDTSHIQQAIQELASMNTSQQMKISG
ncbi:polysaccharide pyruvyl transferase family protein [Coleofasciculus sp. G2-EDA-02]|uniref:polysaccharide pyruvyl transferase family protein n=1 Tax=Coleofasciculus sp. G2-EDA-02 TaxID=3069529 RepID=UPI0033048CC3